MYISYYMCVLYYMYIIYYKLHIYLMVHITRIYYITYYMYHTRSVVERVAHSANVLSLMSISNTCCVIESLLQLGFCDNAVQLTQ